MDKSPHVTIEVFGMMALEAGTDRIIMPVAGKATAKDAVDYVVKEYPDVNLDKESVIIAVNHKIVAMDTMLQADDFVSILPPIGGG